MEGLNIRDARRRILLNTPHLEHASGSDIITFNTDMAAPLKECRIHFCPKQEGDGLASSDNVRPVSGWTGLEFYNSSQNILPMSLPSTAFYGLFSTGSSSISNASMRKCFTMYIGKNRKIYYQRNSSEVGISVGFCDSSLKTRTGAAVYGAYNMQNRSGMSMNSGEHPYLIASVFTANMGKGGTYDVCQSMISFGGTRKTYVPRSANNLIRPDWSEKAGTVYGGYLDLITGELVSQYQFITLGESMDPLINGRSGSGGYANSTLVGADECKLLYFELGWPTAAFLQYSYDIDMRDTTIMDSRIMRTDINRWNATIAGTVVLGDFIIAQDLNYKDFEGSPLCYCYITVPSDCTDLDTKRAYLRDNPMTLCYPLKNPKRYQLDPQMVRAIRGDNFIWSDANGAIDIYYWKH